MLSAACLAVASAKWFPFASTVVASECHGILIITNCPSCCMASYNSATCFSFFIDCLEEVKKPRSFHNISKSRVNQKHSNYQCKYWLFNLWPFGKLGLEQLIWVGADLFQLNKTFQSIHHGSYCISSLVMFLFIFEIRSICKPN